MDIGYPLLPYFLSEAVWYGTLGGTGYLAWRFVRAYERRGGPSEPVESLTARVTTLEDALERTVEAQRFTTQVLLARGGDQGDESPELGVRASSAESSDVPCNTRERQLQLAARARSAEILSQLKREVT